jgi:purine-binding chemotaxis protein CheW
MTDHLSISADHDASETSQLVVLRLGAEEYALPIACVQEIIFFTPPRPVSSDVPWVSGVIALRGKILPVFDLAMRLGVSRGHDADQDARIVIVETGGEQIGVVVDDATEVLTVGPGELEAMPAGADHELLRAITKVGDRLIVILDLTALSHAGGVPTPSGASAADAAALDDAAAHAAAPVAVA